MARFWIGPAGWDYADWAGVVYPSRRTRSFRPLSVVSGLFSAAEVNSSFYAVPAPASTEAWIRETPTEFRFTFKLFRAFTHERSADASLAARVLDMLRPVRDAGRLGPLLMQFPWSFRFGRAGVEHLSRLAELFASVERVIEVRHESWADPRAVEALLRLGVPCNIDQPRLAACLGPSLHTSSGVAYVRLHGRNAAMWFAAGVPAYERYNYLYADAELREWAARLNELARHARDIYVFTNNHYRGQAVANALEIRWMLDGRRVALPSGLVEAYPRLARLALTPRQPTLFGPQPE